jgi:NADPH-dependent 2,4-dienoyl-CoA reductase/sulfur reductase-like enzyme/nitrite reductase/ring-hydroxylating ferredoxin subunit
MGGQQGELKGPNLREGVALTDLAEGKATLGHADGEAVIVVRQGQEVFAIGATCTHYGGPLADGLVDGDSVHCPWHHACFNLRTGEAERAPALNPVDCFAVEQREGKLFVLSKKPRTAPKPSGAHPKTIVIVGGGAAAQAAAEMLRREGFAGSLTMLSADTVGPVDRPNLSKDYLAGTAPEEWIPLRPQEFYGENQIDLQLDTRATLVDPQRREVRTDSGKTFSFDALLLATGAEPNKLSIPGAELSHVRYLRTLADSRAIIDRAKTAKRAVVIGGSFIGLETAAALRTRGIEVHVVAPESRPLEQVTGREIADMVRALHEEHGVIFHLENTPRSIDEKEVTLASGEKIAGDLVVAGIGVKPRLDLAERAGLAIDRGITVDELLQTSAPGIFAAGDIARWPDPHTGQKIRIEHWVVAERLGQIGARNMLGQKVPCKIVPFFWSQHYDVSISYVGHAKRWDRTDIAGDVSKRDCTVALRAGGRTLAVITIGRDIDSLRAELAFEKGDLDTLAALGT